MSKVEKSWNHQINELPLPQLAHTKDGVEFYPRESTWTFRTSNKIVNCGFEKFENATPEFIHGFKRIMIRTAETGQGTYIQNCFQFTLRIVNHIQSCNNTPIDSLSYEDLALFENHSKENSDILAKMKSFIKRWAKSGIHGVNEGLSKNFPPCRQQPPGRDVATQDPRKGPHDDQEFESILESINFAIEKDKINLDRALEVRLCAILGSRPAQIALLKCRDVKRDEYGRITIDVPLIKGLNQATRDEFRRYPIEPTTGDVLWDYREETRAAFASLMKDSSDAPLFPQIEQITESQKQIGLIYHPTATLISQRLSRTLQTAFDCYKVTSARLNGERVSSNARRLRKSFCQRGADEGIDHLTLAHLMGHRDTNSVKVYFSVSNRIRARFSRKIALDMAPLANAFGAQLRIIKDISEATRPIASSRIPDLRLDQHGHLNYLASCASCSDCKQLRPIACLAGCASFEPFLDADLEPILDRLICEREDRGQKSLQIASIRDRAIYGCAQIIIRQRQLRQGESG